MQLSQLIKFQLSIFHQLVGSGDPKKIESSKERGREGGRDKGRER